VAGTDAGFTRVKMFEIDRYDPDFANTRRLESSEVDLEECGPMVLESSHSTTCRSSSGRLACPVRQTGRRDMPSEIQPDLAREMIDQAADAIIFADIHGVIQVWNQAAAVTFGFETTEAIGQSLDLIIPQHLRPAHWAGFHRAIASGTTRLAGRATPTRALHKSGQRLYVEMSFAVVRGPAGMVVGSVAVARDATLRFEQERSQRERSREGEHGTIAKPTSPE